MSLPLTRRIARAALLVAAGAAPVVGAAGSASAVDLPTRDLGNGGLTQLDGDTAGSAVDSTAREAAGTANEAGGKVVGTTLPAAAGTLGGAARSGLPAAQETAGQAAGSTAGVLGETASSTTSQGLPAAQDLAGGGLPDAGAALPVGELPVQGLPL
ncbi:ATP-binding protein [Streptomyces pacificus]|uniref:ATP-binding protein n=1 Tax=Streptomyces pacificus TaxID=2705029 RepID=A0A6A0B1N1_9ACTN|nr:ATP-binding protein [Streptomyces pacificus]GFH37737.1 ATP-binding protein [Streptomyces pacificus]